MWERAVNTMVEAALASVDDETAAASDTDDVNVENLQLLILLFHSLQVIENKKGMTGSKEGHSLDVLNNDCSNGFSR